MTILNETWQRIAEANAAAGVADDWTVAERDQMEALADDLNRELEWAPMVYAWRTKNGSQLQFWCQHRKGYHHHGRHVTGQGYSLDGKAGSVLPLRLWKRYVRKIQFCNYNPDAPGGRGFCTCPAGISDGHRAAHCWKEDSGYYSHGYFLHEVEPNDERATVRPKRQNTKR